MKPPVAYLKPEMTSHTDIIDKNENKLNLLGLKWFLKTFQKKFVSKTFFFFFFLLWYPLCITVKIKPKLLNLQHLSSIHYSHIMWNSQTTAPSSPGNAHLYFHVYGK